jgi:predicted ATPase
LARSYSENRKKKETGRVSGIEGKQLIQSLRLRNILSYGPEGEPVDLLPLNVLIGPNASGKSNLIEVIGLLRATPTGVGGYLSGAGGFQEWLWKGANALAVAEVEATLEYESECPLRYTVQLKSAGQRVVIASEKIDRGSVSRFGLVVSERVYKGGGGSGLLTQKAEGKGRDCVRRLEK